MFWTKFTQKGNSQKRKKEHHNWILHIQISLGTKFQLILTILIFFLFFFFWIKLAQTRNFRSKTKKSHWCVRAWSLLTILNFSTRSRQTQWHFNVSSSSSRRDSNLLPQYTSKYWGRKEQWPNFEITAA